MEGTNNEQLIGKTHDQNASCYKMMRIIRFNFLMAIYLFNFFRPNIVQSRRKGRKQGWDSEIWPQLILAPNLSRIILAPHLHLAWVLNCLNN